MGLVYGEEHIEIDISKGLWLSPTPDAIPEGYCASVINMVKNSRGHWENRKGFTVITTVADSAMSLPGSPKASTAYIPEQPYPDTVMYGALFGGLATPQLWLTYPTGTVPKTTHQAGRIATTDTIEFKTQDHNGGAWGANAYLTAVQYKDRIYGFFRGDTTIFKLTGFTYVAAATNISGAATTGTITAASAPLTGNYVPRLVAYKNRLFLLENNRVWYTDIPTSGGYPETWSTSNFFDLPAGETGIPTIQNALELNGILYIFTNKGIFSLNGSGSVSSWSVDFITDFKVITPRNVALVNGVFVLTDRQKLAIFNGTSINIIGAEIDYLFSIYNSFTIAPFEKGFILTARYYAASGNAWVLSTPPGASTGWNDKFRNFYFDGQVWSEFNIAGVDVLDGWVGKQKKDNFQENISYIFYRDHTNSTYGWSYYDKNSNSMTTIPSLTTRDIVPRPFSTISVKELFLRFFGLINASVTLNPTKNGSTTVVGGGSKAITNVADQNFLVEFMGPEICRRFNVTVTLSSWGTPTVYDTVLPDSVPIFEIKGLFAKMDSDLTTVTEQLTN